MKATWQKWLPHLKMLFSFELLGRKRRRIWCGKCGKVIGCMGKTDPERELDRFETFFVLETGLDIDEVDDFDLILEKLAEWLDTIDIVGEARSDLSSQILETMKEQNMLSKEVEEEFDEEAKEVAKSFKGRKWSKAEIERLRRLYSRGVNIDVLVNQFDRTKNAIYIKAYRIGTKRPKKESTREKRKKVDEMV